MVKLVQKRCGSCMLHRGHHQPVRVPLPTDQGELFAALRRTKLMMASPSDALYSRCGRTDKGVNAHCQVRPHTPRFLFPESCGAITPDYSFTHSLITLGRSAL